MTTRKTIALTRRTFVGEVISLLFNKLSRLVITFLPRSKRLLISWASLVAQMVRNRPVIWESSVRSLGWKDPREEDMATHYSILAWRIPWTEEPYGLQTMGSDMTEWLTLWLQGFDRCLKEVGRSWEREREGEWMNERQSLRMLEEDLHLGNLV